MTGNYSNEKEMFDLVGRTRKILNLARKLYSPEDFKALKAKAHDNVTKCKDMINDDLTLALCITTGGLVYEENNAIYNTGITQAMLSKQVETAYGVKSWFMERDSEKQITLYELFVNEYFDKMFGERGYKQLFSGDATGFMRDFKMYGELAGIKDNEELTEKILRFDRAINNSVFKGEYSFKDCSAVSEFCLKIEEGRKIYEANQKLEEPVKKTTKKKTL